MLTANMPVGKLHTAAVERVRAAYQARAVKEISEMLTEEEADVLRRGRNATGNTVPKSSNPAEYRTATGLESLFGYLYLKGDRARIDEIFDKIWQIEP